MLSEIKLNALVEPHSSDSKNAPDSPGSSS
jgi:hypothetical protein